MYKLIRSTKRLVHVHLHVVHGSLLSNQIVKDGIVKVVFEAWRRWLFWRLEGRENRVLERAVLIRDHAIIVLVFSRLAVLLLKRHGLFNIIFGGGRRVVRQLIEICEPARLRGLHFLLLASCGCGFTLRWRHSRFLQYLASAMPCLQTCHERFAENYGAGLPACPRGVAAADWRELGAKRI